MGRYRRAGHQAPLLASMALGGFVLLAGCAPAGHPSALPSPLASGHSGARRLTAPSSHALAALQPLADGPGSNLLLNTGVRQGTRPAGRVGWIPAQSGPYLIYAVCKGPGAITVATTFAGAFSQPCSNTAQGLDLNLGAEYRKPEAITVTVSQKVTWHVIALIGQ